MTWQSALQHNRLHLNARNKGHVHSAVVLYPKVSESLFSYKVRLPAKERTRLTFYLSPLFQAFVCDMLFFSLAVTLFASLSAVGAVEVSIRGSDVERTPF